MHIDFNEKQNHSLHLYSSQASTGKDIRIEINSEYRGERADMPVNLSDKAFVIRDGESIRQMVISNI